MDTADVCSVEEYDYKKLTVSYGPDRQFKVSVCRLAYFVYINSLLCEQVSIWWDQVAGIFQLQFGSCHGIKMPNPHKRASVYLQKTFNTTKCIPLLLKVIVTHTHTHHEFTVGHQ